jgi:hypothetical protein
VTVRWLFFIVGELNLTIGYINVRSDLPAGWIGVLVGCYFLYRAVYWPARPPENRP